MGLMRLKPAALTLVLKYSTSLSLFRRISDNRSSGSGPLKDSISIFSLFRDNRTFDFRKSSMIDLTSFIIDLIIFCYFLLLPGTYIGPRPLFANRPPVGYGWSAHADIDFPIPFERHSPVSH